MTAGVVCFHGREDCEFCHVGSAAKTPAVGGGQKVKASKGDRVPPPAARRVAGRLLDALSSGRRGGVSAASARTPVTEPGR